MACPSCDHTMHLLCQVEGGKYWHCPRCGTLKFSTGLHEETHVPKLVERCRLAMAAQEAILRVHPSEEASKAFADAWLDIAESIHVEKDRPEDRPQGDPR